MVLRLTIPIYFVSYGSGKDRAYMMSLTTKRERKNNNVGLKQMRRMLNKMSKLKDQQNDYIIPVIPVCFAFINIK